MIRFFLCILFSIIARGACPSKPVGDLGVDAIAETKSKTYTYIGAAKEQCVYFRNIEFNNGHGQQALILASKRGTCSGLYRTPLASGGALSGSALKIKAADGSIYAVDVANSFPKTFFFDGDESRLEKCRS